MHELEEPTEDKLHTIDCIVVLYNPENNTADNIRSYSSMFNRVILVDNSNINNEILFKNIATNTNYGGESLKFFADLI